MRCFYIIILVVVISFPSQSKSSIFGKTEYFQCQYPDGGIKEFKLEIPAFFQTYKTSTFYYDRAGKWIESLDTEITEDKIILNSGWMSNSGCALRKVFSRLKDENNKVFLYNYYAEKCGTGKSGDLYFRQNCKFHEK